MLRHLQSLSKDHYWLRTTSHLVVYWAKRSCWHCSPDSWGTPPTSSLVLRWSSSSQWGRSRVSTYQCWAPSSSCSFRLALWSCLESDHLASWGWCLCCPCVQSSAAWGSWAASCSYSSFLQVARCAHCPSPFVLCSILSSFETSRSVIWGLWCLQSALIVIR